MNRLIYVLIASLALFLSSCKKASYFRVDADSIQTTISGTSGDIKIETDVQKVELSHVPDWVKVSLNEEQNALHYDIPLNTNRNFREDSIVLVNGDIKQSIYVSQSFHATFVKLEPSTLTFSREGGTQTCHVTVDSESALVVDNNDIAVVDGREITVKIPRGSTRNVKRQVTVKCDEQSAILNIEQESNTCKVCGGSGHLNRPHSCGGDGCGACGYTGKDVCSACRGGGLISY